MTNPNLIVFLVEHDFYARNAISSYLAWDRRTRASKRLDSLESLKDTLQHIPSAEKPDTILLDGIFLNDPPQTHEEISSIKKLSKAQILVLSRQPNEAKAQAIYEAGGNGYLIREEVGLRISWMVVWSQQYPFVVTKSTAPFFPDAPILPEAREYPELTDRIRQALMLCVVEGMSAELAADEMGLSPHTIRTYIKEGYSILEAHDQTQYPTTLSPQEKAFMRLTALALDQIDQIKAQDQDSKDSKDKHK